MTPLQARHIAVSRGDRTLLSDVSFAVNSGEILHLRGRNGAGKTSLLEVLCGLRERAGGDLLGQPEPSRLHWVGHRNGLNLSLTPLENLQWWCGLQGQAMTQAVPALERLGVARLRHRPCRSLSAGQKRRCSLARLVLAPRDWWFLDEPLDGLDASGLQLFAELLREHLARGGAAVVTSHQPLPTGVQAREMELGA